MEISQQSVISTARLTQGGSRMDTLQEGQVFSGKAVKVLSGQMAEIAALGQRLTAQLQSPLQAGERYIFQVASVEKGIQLNVLTDYAPVRRPSDQAALLLDKLQLPHTKEHTAFTALAIESGKALSKDMIQTVSAWLGKAGLNDGIEALRFMISRNLPLTEPVFQALVSARSADTMTSKMTALQQMLPQAPGEGSAASALQKIFTVQPGSQADNPNAKAQRLALALQSTDPSTRIAAMKEIQPLLSASPGAITSLDQVDEALAAAARKTSPPPAGMPQALSVVHTLKQALVQLTSQTVTPEAIQSFKEAVSATIPLQHPDRQKMLMQLDEQAASLKLSQPIDAKTGAALLQTALAATLQSEDQAAARLAVLMGGEPRPSADPSANFLRDVFRFVGVDHEAMLASKGQADSSQTIKQELLKLMGETMPAPIREAAEQIVGRLNAQHILSTENGPLQQLVLQAPLQFAEFKGDVTIKWQGKKKNDGKIDADFCRVLFYVDMPNLQNTVIDMQVQNRIVHIHLAADAPVPLMKKASDGAVETLKTALAESGYRLSGVHFKEPQEAAEKAKPPLARIMDEEGYMGVDIRI